PGPRPGAGRLRPRRADRGRRVGQRPLPGGGPVAPRGIGRGTRPAAPAVHRLHRRGRRPAAAHPLTLAWPATACPTRTRPPYHRWFSPSLGRDMELLVFGHGGARVVGFPASRHPFHDWEDRGLVGALAGPLAAGQMQLFCVDQVDAESWYGWG